MSKTPQRKLFNSPSLPRSAAYTMSALNSSIIRRVGTKSTQHLPSNISVDRMRTIASNVFSSRAFLGLVLTAVTRENTLSTTALLTGVTKHVKAYIAKSLKLSCCSTPHQNDSYQLGNHLQMRRELSSQQESACDIALQ